MSLLRRRIMAASAKGSDVLDYLTIIPEGEDAAILFGTWGYIGDDGNWVYAELLGSPDGGANWYNIPNGQRIDIPQGNKLLLKANYYDYILANSSKFGDNFCFANIISYYGQFSVEGTPLSLAHGDDFKTRRELAPGMFTGLFYVGNSTTPALIRINNPESFLPSTELAVGCYDGMFKGCFELENAPVLPAKELAPYCYEHMFYECKSLTKTPELPATKLANWCYSYMFYNCPYLVEASELPATELAEGCYANMFDGCLNLTKTPELPATKLANWCYSYMFYGCRGFTKAPVLPAKELAPYCYEHMFYNCTSLVEAPELPATELTEACYGYMFGGCDNLTKAPILPAPTLVMYCYEGMFSFCKNLNYIEAMFTTTPSADYTYKWVDGVDSTGTFVMSKDADWYVLGTYGIPTNWTVQTK